MYALSTILSVSLTLWSVMRTPILLLFNSETRLRTSFTEIGSTPAKGSSSSIYFGSVARARAISTLRRSPPDKASAGVLLKCSIRKSDNSFSNFACRSDFKGVEISSIDFMLSSTFKPLKIEVS